MGEIEALESAPGWSSADLEKFGTLVACTLEATSMTDDMQEEMNNPLVRDEFFDDQRWRLRKMHEGANDTNEGPIGWSHTRPASGFRSLVFGSTGIVSRARTSCTGANDTNEGPIGWLQHVHFTNGMMIPPGRLNYPSAVAPQFLGPTLQRSADSNILDKAAAPDPYGSRQLKHMAVEAAAARAQAQRMVPTIGRASSVTAEDPCINWSPREPESVPGLFPGAAMTHSLLGVEAADPVPKHPMSTENIFAETVSESNMPDVSTPRTPRMCLKTS